MTCTKYPYCTWQWIFYLIRRSIFPLLLSILLPDFTVYMYNMLCIYKKELLLTFRKHRSSPHWLFFCFLFFFVFFLFFDGVRIAQLFRFCVALLCVFTCWVPCELCMFLVVSNTYYAVAVFVLCSLFLISLDCPFLIAPSVFSTVILTMECICWLWKILTNHLHFVYCTFS